MIFVKKQLMAMVMALLLCVGYSGALVPATAYAAETIGYVDLNTVFSHHPDFASARAAMSWNSRTPRRSSRKRLPAWTTTANGP